MVIRLAWVCVWCYLARFAGGQIGWRGVRAEFSGDRRAQDGAANAGGGEDGEGREKVEFDGAGGRISSLYSGEREHRRVYVARGGAGVAFRAALWRGDGLCGASRRAYGFGFDSDRGAFDQHFARVWALDDSGKQYRADDRVGGRVAGCGSDVHDSGADLFGVWHGIHVLADFSAGAAGRMAGRAVHDSAAAAVDRERARQPDVSGRHGVRGRSGGGRARRVVCGARVLGLGPGRRLHFFHEHDSGVELAAGSAAALVSGRVISRDDYFRIPGSGLHHRAESFGHSVCGRSDFLAAGDARDSIFRAACGGQADLPFDDSDSADDAGRHVAAIHSSHGSGGGGGCGTDYAAADAADDYFGAARGNERCSSARSDADGGEEPVWTGTCRFGRCWWGRL